MPDDQGLEHVNQMGKIASGLIGITRNVTLLVTGGALPIKREFN